MTVMPLVWCGECAACRGGVPHICQRLSFLGIDAPGSLQPRWTVPADTLVPLPAGMSLRTAALAEPTAVAVHDVRRAELAAGQRAVVVGGGPIGLLVAAVARETGADVLLVEPNDARRQLADVVGLHDARPARARGRRVRRGVDEWRRRRGVLRGLGGRRRASRAQSTRSARAAASSSSRSTPRRPRSTSSASSGASSR